MRREEIKKDLDSLGSPEEVNSLDNVIGYVYITGQLVPGK
jgi:hypothetical protein